MNKEQTYVKEFHLKFGALVNEEPTMLSSGSLLLRARLICEESVEFLTAVSKSDFPEMVDALCDLLYVVYGSAVSLGVDLEQFLQVKFYGYDYRLGGMDETAGIKSWKEIVCPASSQGGRLADGLIREANVFLQSALGRKMNGMVFSMCDFVMSIYGVAAKIGVNLDPVFEEVQRSNMTKDGGGQDSGGKVIKGKFFEPPDIIGKLKEQGWIGE